MCYSHCSDESDSEGITSEEEEEEEEEEGPEDASLSARMTPVSELTKSQAEEPISR